MTRSPHQPLPAATTLRCCVALLAVWAAAPAQAQFGFFGSLDGLGAETDPVEISARFAPATADRPAVLIIAADVAANHHIYSITQPPGGPTRTKIALEPSPGYRLLGEFASSPAPAKHMDEVFGLEVEEHRGAVAWYAPIALAEGVDPESLRIAGSIELQACRETGDMACVPVELDFAASLGDASGVELGPIAVGATPGSPAVDPSSPDRDETAASGENGGAADDPERSSLAPPASDEAAGAWPGVAAYDLDRVRLGEPLSLFQIVLRSLAGGLILNVMPCVLPVIGLKVMSFMEQAGHSRVQAFALNLWYSLGILLVFWVLASLVAYVGATFGDHFGDARFNVVMTGFVFALALSLMGVWEIPVPGFAGSSGAQQMAEREGPAGAVVKGVLTTILATPCTGPYVGVALGWTVHQPTEMTFVVFTAIGVGMAAPYLVLGAFPSLLRLLPKPGAWMEAFKQLMGFVLLGTVVWMTTFLPEAMLVPTLAFLSCVGLACWVYARTPVGAGWGEASHSYALCTAILLGGAVFSYGYLLPEVFRPRLQAAIENRADEIAADRYLQTLAELRAASPGELTDLLAKNGQQTAGLTRRAWQPFDLEKLAAATVEQGKTVLVDFSADWCATCKLYESTVLHTEPVDRAIEQAGVVTMYGDFTDKPQWMRETLKALGGNGVPVVAVFPGGDPYRPIVFLGAYTQSELIEAIERATAIKKRETVAAAPRGRG